MSDERKRQVAALCERLAYVAVRCGSEGQRNDQCNHAFITNCIEAAFRPTIETLVGALIDARAAIHALTYVGFKSRESYLEAHDRATAEIRAALAVLDTDPDPQAGGEGRAE